MRAKNRFFTPTLRRRVSLTYLLITILVIIMAVATYLQLHQVQPYSQQIIRNSSDLVQLQKLGVATAALDADLERYLVNRDKEYLEKINQDFQNMGEALTLLYRNSATEKNSGLAEIDASISSLQLDVQNVLNNNSEYVSSGETTSNFAAVYDQIDQLMGMQQAFSTNTISNLEKATRTQSRIASNVVTQSVFLGVVVIVITFIAIINTDRRLRAIITLTNTTAAIAEGDLTREAPIESDDEIGTLAVSFNTMTKQLRETLGNLEQQVADRTLALETSVEVSRRISTILDQDLLVREVVDQLQTAFGYYHVQIYLFDHLKMNLVMVGGTGDAGRALLSRDHTLQKGQGLVGKSAENNQVILIPDVTQAGYWLSNPLLPETKSELAVPIVLGDDVLGVLDVQHDVTNGLSDGDSEVIQSIANQVAIAVRNAQAYSHTQKQAHREAQITAISQQIQSASTIEDVLQIAISELGNILGASRSMIDLQVTALSPNERI